MSISNFSLPPPPATTLIAKDDLSQLMEIEAREALLFTVVAVLTLNAK
jgi:hypothetical protein